MAVEIRRIGAGEWRELRDLRLRALQDAPDAFTATYEEESIHADAHWTEWATELAEGGSSFGLVAESEGRWIGMAVGGPHRDFPGEAGLFAMWVDPSARGAGVARALVEGVAAWARSAGFPVIRLRVTISNEAAVRTLRAVRVLRCRSSPAAARGLRRDDDVDDDGSLERQHDLEVAGAVDELLERALTVGDRHRRDPTGRRRSPRSRIRSTALSKSTSPHA